MAHILSKYPLTNEQLKTLNLPLPPKLVSVTFLKCGHPAEMFEKVADGRTEINDYCWGCKKSRR